MTIAYIRFTKPAWNAVHGAFAADDLLRCDERLAHHFVVEAHCAVYVEPYADTEQIAQSPADAECDVPAQEEPEASKAPRRGRQKA